MLKSNQIEMIQTFAKQNKISRAKLQKFTEQVIQTLPKATVYSFDC